jgi:glutaminyl-tRNA synthetase
VRLRYGPIIKCERVVTNDAGEPIEIVCSHDASSLDPAAPPRRVKGVIHWASATNGIRCEVRSYDRLFAVAAPGDVAEGEDFKKNLNASSLEIIEAYAEPSLAERGPGTRFQFERLGFYVVDQDSTPGKIVVNRTIGLRDSWAKEQAKDG